MPTNAPSFLAESDWETIFASFNLSPRERELLPMAVAGASEDEIAARYQISRNTVHAHMTRIYVKLNAHDRVHLVLRVFEAYVNGKRTPVA